MTMKWFLNLNSKPFMAAEKWLSLPEGTKVIMTCDYGYFKKWDIVTRKQWQYDDTRSVRFGSDNYYYLKDEQWELIEESKEEWLIQDTNGNLTPIVRMPSQGDMIQVRDDPKKEWSDPVYIFICFHKWKALTEAINWHFFLSEYWNLPPQEEVTLRWKTYLVVERGGEKILKLKQ